MNTKILVEGTLPKFIGICSLCDCEVEVAYNHETIHSDLSVMWMNVKCPTKGCNKTIYCYKKPKVFKAAESKKECLCDAP